MKLISILLILSTALTTTVTALDEFSFFPHHPPPPNAVRGPCPALNSLANHGFIPRDGRNLRVPALVFALGKALNVSTEVANKVASAGLRTSSNPNSGTFTLEDLGKHNIIEHDASLSREDVDLGGGLDLRKEVWEEFLGYVNGTGNGRFGLRDAARARWGRVQTSKARNPKFTYSPSGQFNSYVESAIYFELFKDPASMTTSLGFVKVFFEQERLPFLEGWRPTNRIDAFALATNILMLALYTPEKAPDLATGDGSFHGAGMGWDEVR